MHTPLHIGRYYIAVRGTVDMCGDFGVSVRNLTQHEFHTAPGDLDHMGLS